MQRFIFSAVFNMKIIKANAMKKIITLTAVLLYGITSLSSQTIEKKTYKAEFITGTPPVIDGILDDDAWQQGSWGGDFTQYDPHNGAQPSQKTEFKILFDKDNLYIAIKLYDSSPDSIVNRLSRRDTPDGDWVAVVFDSYHDLRTAFAFRLTSAGVKIDIFLSNDGLNDDISWDANWWGKTSINDEGWVAEMKIPFSQVRFENNSNDVWGLQLTRFLYRKQENSQWQYIPKDAPGFVHRYGEMSGLEQIKPKKVFDITPYGVAKIERFQPVKDNPFLSNGKNSSLNAGLDAKIGVTNNLTMDLTINPDFGQVEADPSEVNLTVFETFFQERRPFFVEGNNITQFDIRNGNLFYSRRIGRSPQSNPELNDGWHSDVPASAKILGAAKLTGKTQNGLSVGFIEAITSKEIARIDTVGGRKTEAVEPLTNYFLGRMQKDYKGGNTIVGGIFTNTYRNLDDNLAKSLHRTASSGGIDFTQYFKDRSWRLNINATFSLVQGSEEAILKTQTSSTRYYQRPDNNHTTLDSLRTSLAGFGGDVELNKISGHWYFIFASSWKTPGFELNDLGYLRESDRVISVLWAKYTQWNPGKFYRYYDFGGDLYSYHNFGGDLVDVGFEYFGNMSFKNYWRTWISGAIVPSVLNTSLLRGGPSMKMPGYNNVYFGFNTDSRKKLQFSSSSNIYNRFERSSYRITVSAGLTYKPLNYMTMSFSPEYTYQPYNEMQYVTRKEYNGNNRYIFATIRQHTFDASFRLNLNITPDLSLQYWGQPFIATGKYSDYKYILNPTANRYEDRFKLYSEEQIKLIDNKYNIDENLDGITDYTFNNSDFKVKEFLSNLVIRWEYNPGSTVYFAWSQSRNNSDTPGNMSLFNDLRNLFSSEGDKPHNVFLVKFSYRFGL